MGKTPESIRLVGGLLCLDFVNTTDWKRPGVPHASGMDVLSEATMLVRWGRRLGVLSSRGRATTSDAELAAARDLRATIHELLSPVSSGSAPPPAALERLRSAYIEALPHARIRGTEGAWPLTWSKADPRSVRFAVAANAITLLNDPEKLHRVRQCPGRNCGGLFIDASGRRRWCSMEVCGSRAKMRRLYQRQRTAAEANRRGVTQPRSGIQEG
jgi:predicted RNA-binding Zn ribbon-like protein